MAFHGPKRRHALAYPPLVRAEHPAMDDVRTQGRSLEGLVDCQVTAEVAAQQGAIVRDANDWALAWGVYCEEEPFARVGLSGS